jgi:hypothetical protein
MHCGLQLDSKQQHAAGISCISISISIASISLHRCSLACCPVIAALGPAALPASHPAKNTAISAAHP